MNNALKNGVILGALLIIGSLALSMISSSIFLMFKTYIFLVLFIAALVYFGNGYKKGNGGFLTFGEAFKYLFLISAIAVTLCTIFEYVLFNYINPGLIVEQREMAVEAIEKFGSFLGEDIIEESMNQIEQQEFNTIGKTIQAFIMRLIFPAAGLALIIGAIIKKKRPENMSA